MKTQIFKNAWQLVRELGINFSYALKIAWSEFKMEILYKEYNQGGLFDYERYRIEKKIAPLSKFISNFKPCKIDFEPKVFSNAGAEHWYGIGVYNGD
jgi:hypothetical protein